MGGFEVEGGGGGVDVGGVEVGGCASVGEDSGCVGFLAVVVGAVVQ
ncbi:hypothetical protein [Nocardia sp. NPDC046763]